MKKEKSESKNDKISPLMVEDQNRKKSVMAEKDEVKAAEERLRQVKKQSK